MKKLVSLYNNDLFRIISGSGLFLSAIILELAGARWVALGFYIAALIISGGRVFFDAVRGLIRRDLLDEKFLMSIASIGAFIIGEWSEGVAVMIFFLVGEAFEHHAVRRSRSSIRSLMSIRPDEASVLIDGEEELMDADDVEVGSTIVIRPGERVPLDCTVISGSADIDTSAMTGEALPRPARIGDSLDSGVIVLSGLLHCRTDRTADDSAASRILELVENATENKSKEESFITAFSRVYTPIVVICAVLLAVLLPVLGLSSVEDSIYRALMFLVISCPCALVISVPMAFFGGIGGAASRGILFKGGNIFTRLARADVIALDKTGTLTSGSFTVREIIPHGISQEELSLLVASAESGSNHPIAASLAALHGSPTPPTELDELAGEGIVATVCGERVAVGNERLMARLAVDISAACRGGLLVSKNGVLVGELIISDKVKPEAAEAIESLSSAGIRRAVMITGDKRKNAEAVAEAVGIGEVLSELSPEEKYKAVEALIAESRATVYVGDGINDAPALAAADVGVAMGGIGQDSAIETADLVIMTDDLTRIAEARRIAERTLSIARFNIVFALAVKLSIMVLGALGIANMWLAVFADVGVAVLAILNSMRTLLASRRGLGRRAAKK